MSLGFDCLDCALWSVPVAVDRLEPSAATDLEQLVADLKVVGDVNGVGRLIACERPENPSRAGSAGTKEYRKC